MGRVAGGIAHDFRNLLTVISGQAEVSSMRLDKVDPIQEDLATILKTVDSAKELTQNLLDFSREREITPKRMDLNELVHYLEQMLVRLLGSDFKLKLELTQEETPIVADSSQLEQVVVNLVANARDASQAGDTITVQTHANLKINADEPLLDLEPGDYVCLSVKDEGAGMSDETMEHMYEPFYTTKERGKGTGLGLSTVFGSIKQNQGHVRVNSKLGVGTEFQIILPVANGDDSK
jgi:two-component system, cell cycle sensor histidine kinase and response regulator CckA